MKKSAVKPVQQQRHWLAAALLAVATLVSLWAYFRLIHLNAVDVLYYDEWDYWNPLFRGESVWRMFQVQHGPPREGLGGLLIGMVAKATAWSTRAMSFTVGIVTALAFAAALVLKRRLGQPLTLADALLPLLFFNLAQVESLVVVANPAYGAVPLLLAMLYAIAWTVSHRKARYAAIIVLNFLLIYTGFSMFFAVITPLLLAVDIYRERRLEPIIALVASFASLGVFLIGWVFEPAIACFRFPHERPLQYVEFVALMFGRFIGVPSVAIGSIVLLALVAVVVLTLRPLVRDFDPRSIAIVTLGTWTLLFCANAAVGRVCAGVMGGWLSRYATLLIPGFVAIVLYGRKWVLIALALVVLTIPLRNWSSENKVAEAYARGKRTWADCYRSAKDIRACDAATRFSVYPTPTIGEKLEYLERNRLNLFKR